MPSHPATDLADSSAPVELLNVAGAARFLGVSEKTLANWRVLGSGPAFCRVGAAVRYRLGDLNAWLASRRFHSTAEADAAKAAA